MVVVIVLVLVIAVLSVLNVDPVPINFGFTQAEWPLILVIIGSLFIGALIASLLSMVRFYQDKKQQKEMQKKLDSAEETQMKKIQETKEKDQEQIEKLELELDNEKKKRREAERKLSNLESAQVSERKRGDTDT